MGLTPAMGWSTWNTLGCTPEMNETTLRVIADIMAEQYLPYGYSILAIDDCWAYSRSPNGTIIEDPVRFPSGMAALSAYVRGKGLRFGIYTDRGNKTCAGRPGSFGHEAQDAATYASWGVTYVKNDDCYNSQPGLPYSEDLNAKFRDAVNATGHAMYLNIKQDLYPHGFDAAPALGNSWRVANDIVSAGADIGRLMDTVAPLVRLSGPGAWNDLDSLEIGVGPTGNYPGLTGNESMAMLALWCIVPAQLMMGHDLRYTDPFTLQLLQNPRPIMVNQDPLGISGVRLRIGRAGRDEVWGKPLFDKTFAVVLWNRNTSQVCGSCAPVDFSVVFFASLGFTGNATVNDVWTGQGYGVFTDFYQPTVLPTQAAFVRVMPVPGQHTWTGQGAWSERAVPGAPGGFWSA